MHRRPSKQQRETGQRIQAEHAKATADAMGAQAHPEAGLAKANGDTLPGHFQATTQPTSQRRNRGHEATFGAATSLLMICFLVSVQTLRL